MATNLKDLCRLCGRKNEFSKDLLDEANKNVLDLMRQFTQISVLVNDRLPTKICLNCEDRMVSFQLFLLECQKVQESLKTICNSHYDINVKLENSIDIGISNIKSEVKDELTADDILSAITNNQEVDTEFDDDFYDIDDEADINDDDDDFDEQDNVAIASLKQVKKPKTKSFKKKILTEEESARFQKTMEQADLKVKDFVRLECSICEEKLKSWSGLRAHYSKTHKSKPVVYCLCGYVIRSKSALYKHVTDHKLESKKLRKKSDSGPEDPKQDKYSVLNVKDFVNFICNTCEREFSSWYKLKSHTERMHKIAPIVHCVCGITLKSKSVMYKHIQDHKNPNVICCDKCPRITKTVSAMEKHKMKHIPKSERKFCCASCDKIFTTKDALKSHEKSHIPIEERKIYHCEVCNMKFTTRSSAAAHKRIVHDKVKSYVCDLCGYACGTNGELRQHRAIHSDEKPFVCKKCSKPFKTYSNLKTHMDTHEDTSYACYVCSRVLNSRRTLRKHLLVHEDKCRHVCSYCNKAFKRRQTLKVHMYTHTGDKPLTCKWCDERFAYASTLRSHRLRCHADKMAAQAHTASNYQLYSHVPTNLQEDYVKADLAAIGVTKNEVEAM